MNSSILKLISQIGGNDMKVNDFNKYSADGADSSSSTSQTTSSYWTNPYPSYNAEKGWECPRCKRINAPWVRQCDCSGNSWTITWDSDHIPEWQKTDWWKQVTCGDSCPDNVMNNPVTYQVGGSDYYNPITKAWENISSCSTNTIHNRKTNYKE